MHVLENEGPAHQYRDVLTCHEEMTWVRDTIHPEQRVRYGEPVVPSDAVARRRQRDGQHVIEADTLVAHQLHEWMTALTGSAQWLDSPAYVAVNPPSTASSAPVMNLASSLAKNATAAAMSLGWPRCPMGCWATMVSLNSG